MSPADTSLPECDIHRIFMSSLNQLSLSDLEWLLSYFAETAHDSIRPHLIRGVQNLIADRHLRQYMGQP